MSNLVLKFASGDYDRVDALHSGEVRIDGVEFDFVPIQAPREIFDRMVQNQEFDISELSSSEFISMTGRGDCPFVALPVFPSKAFRHGFICINRHAGIDQPKDLAGKKIGVPLYTQTAAVWIRGMLAGDYGVDLSDVTWIQGAVEKVGSHGNPEPPPLLKPVNIITNRSDKSLSDMLADGDLDAVIGSRMPDSVRTSANVTRLFEDFRDEEKRYFTKTKIHPIMHLIALKRSVYEANPGIGQKLYDAFNQAKQIAWDKLTFSGAQKVMLPSLYGDIVEIDEVFNGDPWPYGVNANRPTLEALVGYMVEQGFIAETIPVDDLFVPVTE